MTFFATRFDFRAPGATAEARGELFARSVEQAEYLDTHGQDALMLSEHHGSPDGYLPSPMLVASAFAARTSRIAITVSALVANLYDPLRLAEDIAVLDHLSGGRVSYTLGLGYLPHEYAQLGRPWVSRGADIERLIGVLRAAWSGEPFEFEGRTAQVTPAPLSKPHPMLFYGGGSRAAALRAARLDLSFQPQVADTALRDLYESECRAHGRAPGFVMMPPPGPSTVFCSEDPDRFWHHYGSYLLADAQAYEAWHGDHASHVRDSSTTVDELRSGTGYLVCTPEDLVEKCRSRDVRLVTSHPLCGGMPEQPSWDSVRLIGEKVLPALRN
ncbi:MULTISPECIES: LLM class flavin-dependent oxidoreductase [Actinomycetes]|uniref:LLM class flavin-dependent oxidoreductase n=1 Tax=Actinomycetes TaxID=1760 RepID=UPI0004BE80EC|nr:MULTISPECIES: LLM class flavin-dependent oxidoreductase [Actinomycetes]